jgi:pimeloyl-ACP methyl ester carboxylesterase
MADFVFVHGAWSGAWYWKKVLPTLWQGGHRAFAVTLTGVGERAHQLSRQITLKTHIDDVIAVIECEELMHAVLVGHSYGGMVITGVADRLTERIERLVYVDAVVPRSGESWSSGHDEKTQLQRRAVIERDGTVPPPDPAALGLTGADAEWVQRRHTPQPGGVYDDPLHFDEARIARLPRCFIDCTQPALPTIAAMRRRVRQGLGWRVVEIPTGHYPMITAPDEFLKALLSAS